MDSNDLKKAKKAEYWQKWYQKNKDKYVEKRKRYYREVFKKSNKQQERAKKYLNKYYRENLDKFKEYQKRDDVKQRKNKSRREKYSSDENYRIDQLKRLREYHKKNPMAKKKQRLYKYRISPDDLVSLIARQNFKCAICGNKGNGDKTHFPVIDHCHSTGKIRGILCGLCNKGLGLFRDNPKFLTSAIQYLDRSVKGEDLPWPEKFDL